MKTYNVKNMILSKTKKQDGYTIVEVVIALAVLLTALLPLSQLTGKLFTSNHSRNLIIAHQLARDAMERAVLTSDVGDNAEIIQLNGKTWHIQKEVAFPSTNLVQFNIAVYEKNTTNAVVSLQTLRLLN